MGRPPLPPERVKGSLLSIRVAADERSLLERAAGTGSLSSWCRRVLLRAAAAEDPEDDES